MMKGRTIVLAAFLLATLVSSGGAQQPASASTRSTSQGVYNAAQAAGGREIYAGMCQECHPPASHTGAGFRGAWGGRTLWELFGYIRERMPKSDPGSLTALECAQVVAYLLQMNGMPAGTDELPTGPVALKAIRFDTALTQAGKGPSSLSRGKSGRRRSGRRKATR